MVETKIADLSPAMTRELMPAMFDYVLLPSAGASGGILVAWDTGAWSSANQSTGQFSASVRLEPVDTALVPWSLTVVYGPVHDSLRTVRDAALEPLLICGDFNMIYQARDKSNNRLNLRAMRDFRRALDAMQVDELVLHSRLYTWSNERRQPTLERIDRAFAMTSWLEAFPCHHLRSLSSQCSDHAPLLLNLHHNSWAKPRFRFEGFWARLPGFQEIVAQAWAMPVGGVDACRALDIKFRLTAKALKNWSREHVGSVRQQLFMAKELIAQLDIAQERRLLSDEECSMRRDLKRRCLGLASMARTIARHRSRI
jgi:hypothetical protein